MMITRARCKLHQTVPDASTRPSINIYQLPLELCCCILDSLVGEGQESDKEGVRRLLALREAMPGSDQQALRNAAASLIISIICRGDAIPAVAWEVFYNARTLLICNDAEDIRGLLQSLRNMHPRVQALVHRYTSVSLMARQYTHLANAIVSSQATKSRSMGQLRHVDLETLPGMPHQAADILMSKLQHVTSLKLSVDLGREAEWNPTVRPGLQALSLAVRGPALQEEEEQQPDRAVLDLAGICGTAGGLTELVVNLHGNPKLASVALLPKLGKHLRKLVLQQEADQSLPLNSMWTALQGLPLLQHLELHSLEIILLRSHHALPHLAFLSCSLSLHVAENVPLKGCLARLLPSLTQLRHQGTLQEVLVEALHGSRVSELTWWKWECRGAVDLLPEALPALQHWSSEVPACWDDSAMPGDALLEAAGRSQKLQELLVGVQHKLGMVLKRPGLAALAGARCSGLRRVELHADSVSLSGLAQLVAGAGGRALREVVARVLVPLRDPDLRELCQLHLRLKLKLLRQRMVAEGPLMQALLQLQQQVDAGVAQQGGGQGALAGEQLDALAAQLEQRVQEAEQEQGRVQEVQQAQDDVQAALQAFMDAAAAFVASTGLLQSLVQAAPAEQQQAAAEACAAAEASADDEASSDGIGLAVARVGMWLLSCEEKASVVHCVRLRAQLGRLLQGRDSMERALVCRQGGCTVHLLHAAL
jgi:hypothetical protein